MITRQDVITRFARNLIKLRVSRGLGQTEFARSIGTYREKVAQWERGKNCPQWWTVLKIAHVCDLPVDYFYFGDEEP